MVSRPSPVRPAGVMHPGWAHSSLCCAHSTSTVHKQATATADTSMMLCPMTHLVWRHLELVLHVDGRGGDEGVHTRTLCMAHGLPGCVQVTMARPESSKGFWRQQCSHKPAPGCVQLPLAGRPRSKVMERAMQHRHPGCVQVTKMCPACSSELNLCSKSCMQRHNGRRIAAHRHPGCS